MKTELFKSISRAIAFTLFSISLYAQQVKISYSDLKGLNACGDKLYEISLENLTEGELNDLKFSILFPKGIAYVASTIKNAQEINTQNLAHPQFFISSLKVNQKLTISLVVHANCEAYDASNRGENFSNKIFVQSALGTDSVETSPPFNLLTPFLVITKVPDQTIELGGSGTRTIKITNTGQGPISALIFDDVHDAAMITCLNAPIVLETNTHLSVNFGPEDFKKIGDKDTLFEFNEMITVEEKISSINCLVSDVNSIFTASWGCDQMICQKANETSNVHFVSSNKRAKLNFIAEPKPMKCLCQKDGEVQELIIKNTGEKIAENIILNLTASLPGGSITAGFVFDSLKIIGNVVVDSISFNELNNNCKACTYYNFIRLKIKEIDINQEIRIIFRYANCSTLASNKVTTLNWYYNASYYSKCVPGIPIMISDQPVTFYLDKLPDVQLKTTLVNLQDSIVNDVNDMENFKIHNKITLPDKLTNEKLTIEVSIPCPLVLTDSTFLFDGKKPIMRRIIHEEGTTVIVQYQSPFSNSNLDLVLPVVVDCNARCIDSNLFLQIIRFHTSCADKGTIAQKLIAQICSAAQLSCKDKLQDCNENDNCGRGTLDKYPINILCNNLGRIDYNVPGYIKFNSDAYRYNVGQSDNDNNRFLDIPSKMDTSLIDRKKFITNDTLVNDISGKVVVDIPGSTFDSISCLISTEVTFDVGNAKLEYYDDDANKKYEFYFDSLSTFRIVKPLPRCDSPVVDKTALGIGYKVAFTPELLHKLNSSFSDSIRFSANDSFHLLVFGKVSSSVGARIYKAVFTHRVILNNRKDLNEKLFFCDSIRHILLQVTNSISFISTPLKDTMCGNNFVTPYMGFFGGPRLANFFNNEFRSLIKADSILINLTSGIKPDSVEIKISYNDSFNATLIRTVISPVLLGKLWYVPLDTLKSIRYDEAYKFEYRIFGSTDDCELLKRQSVLTVNPTLYVSKDIDTYFHVDPDYTLAYNKTFDSKIFSILADNANDNIDILNKVLISSSKQINWEASIPSLHNDGYFVFTLKSSKGLLDNFKLSLLPSASINKLNDSTFLVGPLTAQNKYSFYFEARNQACDGDTILIQSSWFCGLKNPDLNKACVTSFFKIPLVPEQPHLEIKLTQQDLAVNLCDTLPVTEIYLYNADKGAAYKLILDLFLPDGIRIDNNSIMIAYPSNGSFIKLNPPVLIGTNHYRWNFEDIFPNLIVEGLPGVEMDPKNGMRIRFQTYTDCESVVNGYISYYTTAENLCGVMSNALRKDGNQIKIQGVSNQQRYKMTVDLDSLNLCTDVHTLSYQLESLSTTSKNDSLKIVIPDPLHYVPNSFMASTNIDNQNVLIIQNGNNEEIYIVMKDNVPAGQKINFSIKISGFAALNCEEKNITNLLYTKQKVLCKSTNTFCDVDVESAHQDIIIDKESAKIMLERFSISSTINNQSDLELMVLISNSQYIRDSIICFDLYADSSNTLRLDASDPLISSFCYPRSLFVKDGGLVLHKLLNSISNKYCNFILTHNNFTCLCQHDTIFFNGKDLTVYQFSDSLCYTDQFELGIIGMKDAKYVWTGNKVECDTCSKTKVIYNGVGNEKLHFTLLESNRDSCNRKYVYDIFLLPQNHGLKQISEICKNEKLTLDAGSKLNIVWNGPGVVNNTQKTINVLADTIKQYFLNYRDINNCLLIDTFCIFPFPDTENIFVSPEQDTINLGESAMFTITGGKSWTWSPPFGLDCSNCQSVKATVNANSLYSIEVLDSFNCPHVLYCTVFINIPPCDTSDLYVPNAFSPNHDNKNEIFKAYGEHFTIFHMIIYDRWGEKVFESNDINVGWNGEYKSIPLSPDVYGYYIEAECLGGKKFVKKGNLSLLK